MASPAREGAAGWRAIKTVGPSAFLPARRVAYNRKMVARSVLLLCGPTFSGKTTLAAELSRRLGLQLLSMDELNARRGLGAGFDIPVEEWSRTHEIALGELDRMLASSEAGVVVDDTNCFRFLRDNFCAVAERHGAQLHTIALRVSEEELRRRIDASSDEAVRRGIDSERLERHLRSFEWPGDDERAILYPAEADTGSWISQTVVPLLTA